MSLYTRARRHIDMKRVKELREEKIKREKIAELIKHRQEIIAELQEIEREESKSYDWRKDIHEMMTSSGTFFSTLPATGDVDIVNNRTALNGFDGQNHSISSAGTVTLTDDGDNDIADGTQTAFRQAFYTVDGTKSAQLKITIQKGGGTTSWTDRGESWDDDVTLVISDIDNFHAPKYYTSNLTSGTHIINLPGNYKNMRIQVQQFAKLAIDGSPGSTGSLKIYNVSLQRRTPVNVFVGLDDPEASSFVRGGLGGSEERRAQLKDMLEAGNELMVKMGLEPSKTSPGDIMLKTADGGDIEIAAGRALYGPVDNRLKPDGSKGFNSLGELNKGNDGNWYEWDGNKWNPVPSLGKV